jgi:hypothetical protein
MRSQCKTEPITQFLYHLIMQTEIADSRTTAASGPATFSNAAFRTYDPRLEPVAAKVFAGERLDFSDGLALYGSPTFSPSAGWPITCASACTAT